MITILYMVVIHNPTITGMQHGAAHPVPWLGPFLHWEAPRPPCNRHRAQGAGSGENKGADSKAGWSGQGLQGPDVSRVSFYKSFGFKARQTSKTGWKRSQCLTIGHNNVEFGVACLVAFILHKNKRQKTKNQQQKSSWKNPVDCWKFPAGNAGDDYSKICTRTLWAWLSCSCDKR